MGIKNIYDKCFDYAFYFGISGFLISSNIGIGKVFYDEIYNKPKIVIKKDTIDEMSKLEKILIGSIITTGGLAFLGLTLNGVRLTKHYNEILNRIKQNG